MIFGTIHSYKLMEAMKVFNSNSDKFSQIDKQLRASFSKIKEEFDDHKQTINENTDEINSLHEHLAEIDESMDKLNEKMDEISMMIKQVMNQNDNLGLNPNEQKVFLALYAVEATPLSYSDIARKVNLTELAVKASIMNMVNKGIPITQRRIDNAPYFKLETSFKELQAKQNIVKIDQELVKEIKLI